MMTTLDIVLKEVQALPPAKLTEAANFIRQLKARSEFERQQALDRAYGCLSEEEAQALDMAIQTNCENINAAQW